jgi:hypothetical protein
MDSFRKKISGLVVLLLLAAQLALAQHHAVHFSEDGVTVERQHDAPKDKDKAGHDALCHVCLSSKILSHVLLFFTAFLLVIACNVRGIFPRPAPLVLCRHTSVYPPRGPPSLSR